MHKRERERESAFVVLPLVYSIKRLSSTGENRKEKDEPTMKIDYQRTSEKKRAANNMAGRPQPLG